MRFNTREAEAEWLRDQRHELVRTAEDLADTLRALVQIERTLRPNPMAENLPESVRGVSHVIIKTVSLWYSPLREAISTLREWIEEMDSKITATKKGLRDPWD